MKTLVTWLLLLVVRPLVALTYDWSYWPIIVIWYCWQAIWLCCVVCCCYGVYSGVVQTLASAVTVGPTYGGGYLWSEELYYYSVKRKVTGEGGVTDDEDDGRRYCWGIIYYSLWPSSDEGGDQAHCWYVVGDGGDGGITDSIPIILLILRWLLKEANDWRKWLWPCVAWKWLMVILVLMVM